MQGARGYSALVDVALMYPGGPSRVQFLDLHLPACSPQGEEGLVAPRQAGFRVAGSGDGEVPDRCAFTEV